MRKDIAECLADTQLHIRSVGKYINIFVKSLINRAENHDNSKLEEPELSIFAANQPKLHATVYSDGKGGMTPEYAALLEESKPALDHHYANNRHHPQHFPNGVNDMTLVDILEMLCDWKAGTARTQAGNLRQSIETNCERFGIDDQLKQVLINTVREHFTE